MDRRPPGTHRVDHLDGVAVRAPLEHAVLESPGPDTLAGQEAQDTTSLPDGVHTALEQYLRARDIVIYAPGDHVRLVTHRDVSAADVERTADAFEAFFA